MYFFFLVCNNFRWLLDTYVSSCLFKVSLYPERIYSSPPSTIVGTPVMEMDPRVHPIRHLMVTTSMNQSSSFSIDSRTVTCTRPYHRTLDHPRVCVSIQNNGWFKRSSLKTTYSSLLRPDLYFMSFLKYQNTMNIEFRDCKFYSPLDFPLQIGVGLDS